MTVCAIRTCHRTDARQARVRRPGRPGIEWADLCPRHTDEARAEGLLVVDPPSPIRLTLTPKVPPMPGPKPLPLVLADTFTPGACRIAGCPKKIHARGLCDLHHKAASKAGRLDELGAPAKNPGPQKKASHGPPPSLVTAAAVDLEAQLRQEVATLRGRLADAEMERDRYAAGEAKAILSLRAVEQALAAAGLPGADGEPSKAERIQILASARDEARDDLHAAEQDIAIFSAFRHRIVAAVLSYGAADKDEEVAALAAKTTDEEILGHIDQLRDAAERGSVDENTLHELRSVLELVDFAPTPEKDESACVADLAADRDRLAAEVHRLREANSSLDLAARGAVAEARDARKRAGVAIGKTADVLLSEVGLIYDEIRRGDTDSAEIRCAMVLGNLRSSA